MLLGFLLEKTLRVSVELLIEHLWQMRQNMCRDEFLGGLV
jgi:hypothetical protein